VNGEFLSNPEMSMGINGTPSNLNVRIDVELLVRNVKHPGRRYLPLLFHQNRFLELVLTNHQLATTTRLKTFQRIIWQN